MERMRETWHSVILGSERDVLHVRDASRRIRREIEAIPTCEA
jgi:hypothetical protein